MSKKHKLLSSFSTTLLIISTLLCFIVVFKAAFKQDIDFFGYRMFFVTTGSMEPNIKTGSVIIVDTKTKDFEMGDVITFYSEDKAIYGRPNTHRIIGVKNSGGNAEYQTKGDANAMPDRHLVPIESIIGKMSICVAVPQILSMFIAFIGTRLGFLFVVLLPILWLTISCMKDFVKEYKNEVLNKAIDEIEKEKNNK